jgi:hypothetical protein
MQRHKLKNRSIQRSILIPKIKKNKSLQNQNIYIYIYIIKCIIKSRDENKNKDKCTVHIFNGEVNNTFN